MTYRPAPVPMNEEMRLKAVERTGLLDIINEDLYAVYCHLARKLTDCPQSWANVIDADRQFNFILDAGDAENSDKEEFREIQRDQTFCQYALLSPEPLIVPDLTKSDIFKNHPSVLTDDGPRFYAAFPLVNSEGFVLGSFCVRDFRPRRLPEEVVGFMKELAAKLSHQIDIQTNQRQITAERVITIIEKLQQRFPESTLKTASAILACIGNRMLSVEQKEELMEIGLLNSNAEMTDIALTLHEELGMEASVLRRMKLPDLTNDSLVGMFDALK